MDALEPPVLPLFFFRRDYVIISEIGSGQYGKVWRCESRQTRKPYACKQMRKRGSERGTLSRHVRREIAALYRLRGCANVVSLHAVYEDSSHVFLLLEIAEAGDLFALLGDSDGLPEPQARHLFSCVARGVQQCHARGVLHRDLKPDNFLLCPIATSIHGQPSDGTDGCPSPFSPTSCSSSSSVSTDLPSPSSDLSSPASPSPRFPPSGSASSSASSDPSPPVACAAHRGTGAYCCRAAPRFDVKLADFGLSVVLRADESAQGYAGSYPYEAPEVLRDDRYAFPADVWSLGVALFAMLSASWPSFAAHHALDERSDWQGAPWDSVSDRAKNLIRWMLQEDPDRRPTIAEVLSHPWLTAPCCCRPKGSLATASGHGGLSAAGGRGKHTCGESCDAMACCYGDGHVAESNDKPRAPRVLLPRLAAVAPRAVSSHGGGTAAAKNCGEVSARTTWQVAREGAESAEGACGGAKEEQDAGPESGRRARVVGVGRRERRKWPRVDTAHVGTAPEVQRAEETRELVGAWAARAAACASPAMAHVVSPAASQWRQRRGSLRLLVNHMTCGQGMSGQSMEGVEGMARPREGVEGCAERNRAGDDAASAAHEYVSPPCEAVTAVLLPAPAAPLPPAIAVGAPGQPAIPPTPCRRGGRDGSSEDAPEGLLASLLSLYRLVGRSMGSKVMA
eukprot:TRINITY_DN3454_c0_g1_i3.p1 TRINITY_DN3454_c0_g1~~TRINITY_DN3454_c0_g1_i3.p1  ORF type:complete len:679 (-),score=-51.94 TRINITY_DN3454_c0_g1_i3:144-2180(-)